MAKKILFATGCSYTDKDFLSFDDSLSKEDRGGWKFWPEIMADELDLTCVNSARCGTGSDFIFNETIKAIAMYGDRLDTIAILWSGSDRVPFYTYNFIPLVEIDIDPKHKTKDGKAWDPFSWMDDIGIGKVNRNYWKSPHFNPNSYNTMIENQLIKMLSIIEICKARNIKLVMAQGVTFFNQWALEGLYSDGKISERAYISASEVINIFMKNPIFPELERNKNKILGWPILRQLGGKTFDDIRADKERYFISKLDRHPNAEGQILFADMFLKHYKGLYE